MANYEESEEYFLRLKSMVELSDDAIIGMDLNGTIFSWNNGAKVLYGYSPAEVVGKSISIIIPPEHQNELTDILEQVKSTVKGKAYDSLRIKKDGTRIAVSVTVSPITDMFGEIVGASSIERDITNRKLAEDALRESENKYRQLVDNAAEAVLVAQDGAIRLINPTAIEVTGYSAQELLSKPFLPLIHPDDHNRAAENLQKLLKREVVQVRNEFRMVTKDGRTKWVKMGMTSIEWDGRPAVLTLLTEVTELKVAEDALRESEMKYRTLVNSASEAILVVQDRMFRLVNPMAVTMTGYSEKELMSKPFLPLIHPADREMVLERHQKRLRGEVAPNRYAFRMLVKDGNYKWMKVSAIRIVWEDRPATLNFLTDLTERKQSEMDLKKKTAEAMESRQRAETYFDFLAHDIANILSPIMAYADILKTKSNNAAEVANFSSKILEQIQRASSLIANLRRLESIEKTHPNEIDAIDLRTLFSSLDDSIRSDFPNKEISIFYDIPDVESMNVKGGEWAENVLRCVCDNAVRYSIGPAVKLEIRASMFQQEGKGTCWQIEVSDHGPGIDDSVKNHFADSMDTATLREFKGVASSLPFCCSIMKCLGGELLIEDRIPGDSKHGTRIMIRLPKGE